MIEPSKQFLKCNHMFSVAEGRKKSHKNVQGVTKVPPHPKK